MSILLTCDGCGRSHANNASDGVRIMTDPPLAGGPFPMPGGATIPGQWCELCLPKLQAPGKSLADQGKAAVEAARDALVAEVKAGKTVESVTLTASHAVTIRTVVEEPAG
jgi:hypothetical protein